MRVLMIAACPFPARRGTPLRIQRLAEALALRGQEVHLVAYHITDGSDALSLPVERIFNRTICRGLAPGPTFAKLLFYDPALAIRVASALARQRPDIIHAHHCEGLLAAAYGSWRYRVPLVFDAHTLLAPELPSYRIGLGSCASRHFGAWLDGLLPRLADHTLAVTDDIRHCLITEHGINPDRVSVAMNGVELERFAIAAAAPGRIHESAGPRRLIYTGTLAPYQGIDLLLHAFGVVRRSHPEIQLDICTDSQFTPWEPLAAELDIVGGINLIRENLETLPQRLAEASVALLPRPICAGIPQKLLNYMAAAKPIVAFAGSAKTLVHEKTGLVVPGDDQHAFAAAILRLLDAPDFAGSLGRAAREWVAMRCSWARTAANVEATYLRLLDVRAQRESGTGRRTWGLDLWPAPRYHNKQPPGLGARQAQDLDPMFVRSEERQVLEPDEESKYIRLNEASEVNCAMREAKLVPTSKPLGVALRAEPWQRSAGGRGLHILMVAPEPFFSIRGTPFSILHRIRALTVSGHHVDLVTYPFGEDVPIERLRIVRAPSLSCIREVKIGPSLAKLLLDLPLYRETVRALRARSYDVLHSHEEAAFFAVDLARRFGMPHVYDMHSSLPQQLSNFGTYDQWPVRALFTWLERRVLRSCDGVITICHELAEIVAKESPLTLHAMIENAADDTQVFGTACEDVRAKLGLHGRAVVLYTGTFEPYQGLDLLLCAFANVIVRHADARLVIVGGQVDQINKYRKIAVQLQVEDEVTFVGPVHPRHIADFLRVADVIVSPRSRGTNTPLKIYRYLRSGRPLVATALRSHTQVLDSEVACLVPPNAAGLAEGIERVLSDRVFGERLARAAMIRAAERFSDADYIARVRDFYDRMIEKRHVAMADRRTPVSTGSR